MAGRGGKVLSEQLSDRGDGSWFRVRAFWARGSTRAKVLSQEELTMFKR